MNVYLESAGLVRDYRRLDACCRQFGTSDPIRVHLICRRTAAALPLRMIAVKSKAVAALTVHVPVRGLTGALIRLHNSSVAVSCVVLVDRALTRRQWKRIYRLDGLIRIVDTAKADNEKYYRTNRNVVYEKGGENTVLLADLDQLTASDKVLYQCRGSSCLGKTLFIAGSGDVSFCPQHPRESLLGTADQLDGIFEKPAFYEILSQAVQKRGQCKAECAHFQKCKGGCPLEERCEEFRSGYTAALQDRDDIIRQKPDLRSLPLYKELAVLRYLSDPGIPKDEDIWT